MNYSGLAAGLTGGGITALHLTGAFSEAINAAPILPEIVTGIGVLGIIPSALGAFFLAVDTYINNGERGIPISQTKEIGYTPDTGFCGTATRSWAVLGAPALAYTLLF